VTPRPWTDGEEVRRVSVNAQQAPDSVPISRVQASAATPAMTTKVRRELQGDFESAVAFADHCSFLTAGVCGQRATQLIEIAEALMAETLEMLGATDCPRLNARQQ
jgi:3-methyladenine DNA glycosylase/8-oxoguanine DNA glycosylase